MNQYGCHETFGTLAEEEKRRPEDRGEYNLPLIPNGCVLHFSVSLFQALVIDGPRSAEKRSNRVQTGRVERLNNNLRADEGSAHVLVGIRLGVGHLARNLAHEPVDAHKYIVGVLIDVAEYHAVDVAEAKLHEDVVDR